jgi:cytoskeletal protein RodZ
MNKTVGKRLQEARNERKMSLSEVQQISKVPQRHLDSIENDDYDTLPGRFYAKAFIKQYANAVGLDGQELVDQFEGKEKPIELTPDPFVYHDDEEQHDEEVVEVKTRRRHEAEPHKNYIPLFILSFLAIFILVSVLYITISTTNSSTEIKNGSEFTIESSSSKDEKESSRSSSSSTSSSSTSSTTSAPTEEMKLSSGVVEGTNVTYTAKNMSFPFELTIKTKQGVTLAFTSSPPYARSSDYPVASVGVKGTTHTLDLKEQQLLATNNIFQMTFELYDSATRQYVEPSKENVTITLDGKDVDLTKIKQLGRMTLTIHVEKSKTADKTTETTQNLEGMNSTTESSSEQPHSTTESSSGN